MTVTAVIAEYNPFHNGHAYHLAEARRRTGTDFLIAVMSGDFVQRGEPAIIDKYSRTEAAVRAGADLVLELPSCYACASAEYFAGGAVSLLNDLGCVDYLCFGSECGDLSLLSSAAEVLALEPENYRNALKEALKAGMSFPRARQEALMQTLAPGTIPFDAAAISPNNSIVFPDATAALPNNSIVFSDATAALPNNSIVFSDAAAVLSHPNDILGVEYLKALKKTGSRIRPVVIRRAGSGYHSERLDTEYPSAAAIRAVIRSMTAARGTTDTVSATCTPVVPVFACGTTDTRTGTNVSDPLHALQAAVPEDVLRCLSGAYGRSFPLFANDFSFALHVKLLSADRWEDYTAFFDVPEPLARRIFRLRGEFTDFDSFVSLVCTRNFTETHVRRALLHILLDIPADLPGLSEKRCYYAKVLGLRRSDAAHAGASDSLLAAIKKNGRLPLLSKPADARAVLSRFYSYSDSLQTDALRALRIDQHCSDLYRAAVTAKFGVHTADERARGVFIL